MKPQDVVIILKILSLKKEDRMLMNVAYRVKISLSEVSEGVKRLKESSIMYGDKKVNIKNLQEFLFYGFKYCFPAQIEMNSRGIATAHSTRFMSNYIKSDSNSSYVWPYEYGESFGFSIKPLYKTVPQFIEKDDFMYESLSYLDVFRVGRLREIEYAQKKLEKLLKHNDN